MSTTVDLACTACAWVDKDNPTTNYHGAASYELQGYKDGLLLLSFETLPQQYWGNEVESVTLNFTVDVSLQKLSAVFIYEASDGFDESSVTYDTRPPNFTRSYGIPYISSGSGDKAISCDLTVDGKYPENIHFSLRAPAFYFQSSSATQPGDSIFAYTNYAAAGKRPYLRVVVSDSLLIPDAEQDFPPSGVRESSTVLADQPCAVSWILKPLIDGEYGYGPVQSSAVFRWSTTNTEPWNEYEISGTEQSVSFPANTFPAHGSIYWHVSVTCYGGYTTLTSGYFKARLRAELPLLGGAAVSTLWPDDTKFWEYPISSSTNPLGPNTETVDLFHFGDPSAGFAYNAIFNAGLYFKVYYGNKSEAQYIGGKFYKLAGPFDADHVTWNTKPEKQGQIASWSMPTDGSIPTHSMTQLPPYLSDAGTTSDSIKEKSLIAATLAKAGNILMDGPLTSFLHTDQGKYILPEAPLTLRLWFMDTIVTSKPEAAVYETGYVNPHEEQTFAWTHVPDGDYWCVGGWETVSATFYWSSDNGSTWNSVAAEANSSEVVLPAETLPTGTIKWYVTATDDQGTTASSEVYTVSTTDSATTATPIVPKETVENGDAPIRFSWEAVNGHGTEPTGADLQKSNDGTTWTTLAQISTGATQYDAPAGTFSTGARYWRVRAYNADGVAGAWSDPVTFVVVAAPPAPVVSADGKPYATITWQSSGQMAYRVTVDGTSYGPYFGSAKSFEVPDFLTDGSHTAEVSVQGEAGLWSQPGSVTFQVANIPGDPVSLTGKFGRDAALRWSTEATVANFYIYRDGIRIAHTAAKQFTDRFVLGAHEYFVVNKLPGGYYTRSNLSSGTMRSCVRAVAAFDGSGWLEMALSDESDTTEEFAWNQVVSERYVTGSDLPVVETSPYRSGSGSYRISFANVETGAAFEALRGRKVIVKSRGGNVAIGVLSGYTKTMGNFYINYVFSVRSCSWEDYVDETGD